VAIDVEVERLDQMAVANTKQTRQVLVLYQANTRGLNVVSVRERVNEAKYL
jgi:hypothetical protein